MLKVRKETMERYSIHRALKELKTLDSRIQRAIEYRDYIGRKKNSSNKVEGTGYTVEEFKEAVKSNYQSILDLIKRRNTIKQRIVLSNAKTIVSVGGKEYTVAEAIERKTSIEYDKDLLAKLKSQYNNNLAVVTRNNEKMESSLDNQIANMLGSDSNKNSENVKLFSESYRQQNGWDIVNPLGLFDIIMELEKEIEDFEAEIDYVLSESNAITTIEI